MFRNQGYTGILGMRTPCEDATHLYHKILIGLHLPVLLGELRGELDPHDVIQNSHTWELDTRYTALYSLQKHNMHEINCILPKNKHEKGKVYLEKSSEN